MASSDLARLVRGKRDEIASRFAAAVERKEVAPAGVSRPLLVDHIPRFLDEIVTELERAEPVRTKDDVVDTSATARAHGEQRWTLGYDLDGLIREYGVLRHCILVTAEGAVPRLMLAVPAPVAGGQAGLRIDFAAPSPLGLLAGSIPG